MKDYSSHLTKFVMELFQKVEEETTFVIKNPCQKLILLDIVFIHLKYSQHQHGYISDS